MMFHPFTAHLMDFAEGTLDRKRRRSIAQHLADCSKCRRTVTAARGWIREGEEDAPKPSAQLRSRIVQAAAEGTHVILPVADPLPPVFAVRRFAWPAGAAALAVAGVMLMLPVTEVGADRSSLEFSPANPQRGDIIDVTYRPGGRFAGKERLVLRGRLRTANKLQRDRAIKPHAVTVLTKRGRGYVGSFVLPDSVVYGAFAVEDETAEEVDSDGERLWDLLTDEYAARVQFRHDLVVRDFGRVYEAARLETELYPESPTAWSARGRMELRWDGDSVLPRYVEQYARLRVRSVTSVDDVAGLYWLATSILGDSIEGQQWKTRLSSLDPTHPYLIPTQGRPPRQIRRLPETMRQHANRIAGVTDSTVWTFSRSQPLPDVPGLRDVLSDRVTVVAQWTRFSPSAHEMLAHIERLGANVQRLGADLIIVTRDKTDPPTALPFVHDPRGRFGRAFNAVGQYHFAIVDHTGRVRFHHEDIDPILLQVTALRAVFADH